MTPDTLSMFYYVRTTCSPFPEVIIPLYIKIANIARRSMLVMTNEARYNYKHSISKELVETLPDGTSIERSRRVSFTFRQIISFTGECSK